MLVHRDPFKRRVKLTSRGYANFPPPINLDIRSTRGVSTIRRDFSSVRACLVYVTLRHDRSIDGGAAQSEAALEMETRARAGKLADCSTCISVHRSPNDPVSTAGHG